MTTDISLPRHSAADKHVLDVLRRTFPQYKTWDAADSIVVDRAAFAKLMELCRTGPDDRRDLAKHLDGLLAMPSFLHEADQIAAAQFWEQSGNIGHVGSAVVHLIRMRIRAALNG